MMAEVDRGMFVRPNQLTLNPYLDQWLEVVKPRLSERTSADYADLLRRYVRPSLGNIKLAELSSINVQALYARLSDRGLSPRIVRYTHTVLSMALKKAVKWSMLRSDPTALVELPKQVRKEVRAFTPEQAAMFLKATKESNQGLALAFALVTGLRPEEYFGLQWKDVDWKQGTITVRRALIWRRAGGGGGWYTSETTAVFARMSRQKTQQYWVESRIRPSYSNENRCKTPQSRRTIPVPPSLMRELREHKREQSETRLRLGDRWRNHDLVFTAEEGGPLMISNLRRYHLLPTLKRAGLDGQGFTLYSLRHSCATLLLSAGENPKVVAERLGHANITLTLQTYSHVLPHMQQAASDKLERMLFGDGGLKSDTPLTHQRANED